MINTILDVSATKAMSLEVDAAVSFGPFLRHLQNRIAVEKTVKASFYRTIIEQFEMSGITPDTDIPLDKLGDYGLLMEYIYACVSPVLSGEEGIAWGLAVPLQPIVFYGTEAMYKMLTLRLEDNAKTYVVEKTPADYHRERLHFIYSLILKRLYNFQIPAQAELHHAWTHAETGLLRYYSVSMDTDYLDVTAKGALPELNFSELQGRIVEASGYDMLEEILPLHLFRFRGFAVLNVCDVTAEQAVDNIRNVRLTRTPGNEEESYNSVISSLKTLVKNDRIEFDLFPFVRVNGKPVYGYVKGGNGILFSVWGEQTLTPEQFSEVAEDYCSNPKSFFSPDINGRAEMLMGYLNGFRKAGVRSLALFPLFYNHSPVGVLCMHTWKDQSFDEKIIALLEPAITPIGQLLQIYIDEFNLELENIIKEHFTSIQPSVQWKFNEVAWHYLHARKKHRPLISERIDFKEVYPIYGAVDIRNSTVERNMAIKADLENHLQILGDTLAELQPYDPSSLMQEMRFNCSKWQQTLQKAELGSLAENTLNNFLAEESCQYLHYVREQDPKATPIVDNFLGMLQAPDGPIHHHRHALEISMQLINTTVNNYFEKEKEQLQRAYPCYFEKFRTDGVEYDAYIGQSISPDKPFNPLHLKNIRVWQLSSMVAVTRLTKELMANMAHPLETTQLIFIHNHTIDISFRPDERKFDVEGAYNIRYQMIKKRIDKVHVKGTTDRLTQPGKIALIYSSERDITEYRPFIAYLQETNALSHELEELELEELQGLSGLKALRVSVIYPE